MESDLPSEINIISLNCWGLKYLSTHRAARLTQIGQELAHTTPSPDIVALQECWTQEDYRSIRSATSHILPYGKFYHGGSFGSGLAILSRWPIESSSMRPYPLNGRPTAFWRGDWYVGKGVAHARIRYGPGRGELIEVFNTHTHAPYEQHLGLDDSYRVHGIAQAWELSKMLRDAGEQRGKDEKGCKHLIVAAGDFNMVPSSLAHRILTANSPVRDVWRALYPDSAVGRSDDPAEKARRRPLPTARVNVEENGVTSDSVYNTWRWTKAEQKLLGPGKPGREVSPDMLDPRGHRLDYIFASTGAAEGAQGGWVVKRAKVGMTGRHPELDCSLSDHFSIEATLSWHVKSTRSPLAVSASASDFPEQQQQQATTLQHHRHHQQQQQQQHHHHRTRESKDTDSDAIVADDQVGNGTYLQSPATSLFDGRDTPSPLPPAFTSSTAAAETREQQQRQQRQQQDEQLLSSPIFTTPGDGLALTDATYDEILSDIHRYMCRERRQRRWRGHHFYASLVISLGCLVAVWFSPHNYVSFLLMLLSTLGLAAGTVDGLIALLFFGSEMRALKEFEWEIVNAKTGGSGDAPLVGGLEDDDKRW